MCLFYRLDTINCGICVLVLHMDGQIQLIWTCIFSETWPDAVLYDRWSDAINIEMCVLYYKRPDTLNLDIVFVLQY